MLHVLCSATLVCLNGNLMWFRRNPNIATVPMHTKKPAKKSDMRVSCEAIPEEISGTSPLPHPHPHPQLCTFNSDPG